MHSLLAVAAQPFENRPAGRIGKGLEEGVACGVHAKPITRQVKYVVDTTNANASIASQPDRPLEVAGAPEQEIEITSEMVEAGLVWLYSYIPDHSDSQEFVKNIIKAALANLPPRRQK